MALKNCFKCGIKKPLRDFYRHPMMADGRLNKCKDCTRKDVTEHRGKNVERIRAYDRKRAKEPERKKDALRQMRKWRKEDKRRAKAHSQVARAIKRGDLIRQPCEKCKRTDSYAHHENYDNPLDVRWLCQPCHKVRHKELKTTGVEP